MKLAVSHLAWTPEEDEGAYRLLRAFGLDRLEVAPTRWWPHAQPGASAASLAAGEAGFSVAAFQAILFGRDDLTLFGAPEPMLEYLGGIAELATSCGARRLVFGAPRQRRRPENLPENEAFAIAIGFFRRLAALAETRGVAFCLEPNPAVYGGNFITELAEAVRIVRAVASPGLRLQIDAGALALEGGEVAPQICANADLIGHVHVSQPMLAPFDQPWPGHATLAAALRAVGYAEFVSLEMKRSDGLPALREALTFLVQTYGPA